MKKDDFVYKELYTQLNRLKYIDALLNECATAHFYPRRIFVEPTNYCNCRCIHCPGAQHMTRPRGNMSFPLFQKIIDEVAPLWPYTTINLYQQGEPLLHPRIYDMVDYAQGKNLFVKLNTNLGALKKKDIPRLLKVDYLEISVDAATASTYRTIKGNKKFHHVIDNLLDFLEAWGETATSAAYGCDISFLKQKFNHAEGVIFDDMFSRLPCGHVNVFSLHNFTGAISEGEQSLSQDQQSLPRTAWPCCNTPWDMMGINWDGSVVACVYDYNSRYKIGDVNNMGVLDCWNSPEMICFRQALLDRNYSTIEQNGPLCSNCSIMWLPDYSIPQNFYSEIGRMEKYLSAAIHRVADQTVRYDKLMAKWRYLKEHREDWKRELAERTQALSEKSGSSKNGGGCDE